MAGNNRQIEEQFFAAEQSIADGLSVESIISEHPEYSTQTRELLQVVAALKEIPSPVISPEAMSLIEKRAQLAAKHRQAAFEQARAPLSIVRPDPTRQPVAASTHKAIPAPVSRRNITRVVAMIAVIVLTTLAIVGALSLEKGFFGNSRQLESYTGVIMSIEPGSWLVDDDAEMIVDHLTEIHGTPSVGAQMTCIAERLPGHEKYRALEIWILSDPSTPPNEPTESSPPTGSTFTLQAVLRY